MKKILLLIDGLGSGGAQRQLVGLATLLRRKGYETTLMWYHEISFFQPFLEENDVRCMHVVSKNRYTKFLSVLKTIIAVKPNVVVAYIDGPCEIACVLKMLGLKSRLIVSERNTTQNLDLHQKIKFFLYRFSDVIVPNSFSQENFIQKHYSNLTSKIYTITNFVDTSKYIPIKKRDRTNALRILTVGRINQQKNVLRFLRVVNRISLMGLNVHFDWYGAKHDMRYASDVELLYKELGLDKTLTFNDSTTTINVVYGQADIFCLPSLYEGYPNVVCEAMSCGLPIVCGNICDNPQIVEDGNNGFLFDPTDEEDMFQKILQMIHVPQEIREQMGKCSRKIAIEKFSSDMFIKKYINIIE